MSAIGMALVWFGYSVALYGWTQVRQYDVGYLDLINPTKGVPWPPRPRSKSTASQPPQPVVQPPYLAPLTEIVALGASALSAIPNIAGAVGGTFSDGLSTLENLINPGSGSSTPPSSGGKKPPFTPPLQ